MTMLPLNADEPPAGFLPPPPPRGRGGLAWAVIILMCIVAVGLHLIAPAPEGEDAGDPIGLTLMQIQSKYMVGLGHLEFLPIDGPGVYESGRIVLNAGTVDQRQRWVIVAAELAGGIEARGELDELDEIIAEPPVGDPVQLTEDQASVQRILRALYGGIPVDGDDEQMTRAALEAVEALDPSDRSELVGQLGWFGELALAPAGTGDTAQRAALVRSARIVVSIMLSAAVLGVTAAVAGFIGLVVLVVLALTGVLRSGLSPGRPYHAVYAETFAVWLVLFFGLQLGVAMTGLATTPAAEMALTAVMFFASLTALAWPVWRGIAWADVRRDIGWTLGKMPWAEPLIGVGGYVATLPLLVVGLFITLGLLALQGAMAGEAQTFAPTGGPAHPIIVYMAGESVLPKILVLVIAVVAAPIVEETMFRGVLYRHLRDGTARLGLATSVVLSTGLNAFIFAAIHPQGFAAVPALMSLACGMALVREWRGTLIPSMVMHGLGNGLIMGFLLILLSA